MTKEPAPEIATFVEAAPYVGCRTGQALRMRFRRKVYPETFLVHITPKIAGVAVAELIEWIKTQRFAPPAPDAKPEQETAV